MENDQSFQPQCIKLSHYSLLIEFKTINKNHNSSKNNVIYSIILLIKIKNFELMLSKTQSFKYLVRFEKR